MLELSLPDPSVELIQVRPLGRLRHQDRQLRRTVTQARLLDDAFVHELVETPGRAGEPGEVETGAHPALVVRGGKEDALAEALDSPLDRFDVVREELSQQRAQLDQPLLHRRPEDRNAETAARPLPEDDLLDDGLVP